MSIKIPINAELDKAGLQQIEAAFNQLGKTAEQAGRIKFAPISKVSVDEAVRMRKEFETMIRLSPGLKKALEAGGQSGKNFDQVEWNKVWKDPRQRAAHAQTMVAYLNPEHIDTVLPSSPTPSGAGDGGRKPPPAWQRAVTGGAAGMAGGIASQIGGPVGAMASGALAGGLAGGLPGAVIGGVTGAITGLISAIGEARQVAINLDTLKRNLGDVNVSFNDLKGVTRGLSTQFALSDDESVRLTQQYSRTANADGKDPQELARQVGTGVGFSRSFGLDPSVGVDFFARMQGIGVTRGADDQKRLALMIGESVAKAGDLPKMADVMAGLSRYLEGNARSLNNAGAAGWLSHFAGLEQSGIAGMNPDNAANIISQIDNTIRQGGTSEAAKNFMSASLQRSQGLTPLQAATQLEGGAFATGASTFGPNSVAAKYYAKFGGGTNSFGNWSSGESNISILQRQLMNEYRGQSPDLMADAFANTFGTSRTQAMAWMASDPAQTDAMAKRMDRLGVKMKDVNATGINAISQIEANGSLSEAEKDKRTLETASKNQEDTEGAAARKAQLDGANAMKRLADEGLPIMTAIQSAVFRIAGMDKVTDSAKDADEAEVKARHSEAVAQIRPLTDEMNAAKKAYDEITPTPQQLGLVKMTPEQTKAKERYEAARQRESDAWAEEKDRWNADKAAAGDRLKYTTEAEQIKAQQRKNLGLDEDAGAGGTASTSSAPVADGGGTSVADLAQMTPQEQQDMQEQEAYAALGSGQGGAQGSVGGGVKTKNGSLTAEQLSKANAADQRLGLPPGTTAALILKESSGNLNAKSRVGARGAFQIMPDNVAHYSKEAGRQLDPHNFDDGLYMYERLMQERKAKTGGDPTKMLRTYHGGYDESQWGAENRAYVPKIEQIRRELAQQQQKQQMAFQHSMVVDINLGEGKERLETADISTRYTPPSASGAN